MGKIKTLLLVSGLQKVLLATEGYTINKIPNIPQCTLPPRPVYQTLEGLGPRLANQQRSACSGSPHDDLA